MYSGKICFLKAEHLKPPTFSVSKTRIWSWISFFQSLTGIFTGFVNNHRTTWILKNKNSSLLNDFSGRYPKQLCLHPVNSDSGLAFPPSAPTNRLEHTRVCSPGNTVRYQSTTYPCHRPSPWRFWKLHLYFNAFWDTNTFNLLVSFLGNPNGFTFLTLKSLGPISRIAT